MGAWLISGFLVCTVIIIGEIMILADAARIYLQYEPGNSGSVKLYLDK
jgi:hypothetical protein